MELSVVTAIMMLFAAVVVPAVVNQKERREEREFRSSLLRLVDDARERAIESGKTVSLVMGDGDDQLQVTREGDDDQEDTVVRSLTVHPGFEITSFEMGGDQVAPTEWKLRFYPEGKADGGGFELRQGTDLKSLVIDKTGNVRLSEGPLPDTSQDKWPAGEFEKRA
jgi:type II secretory pathway pseudopilin PulG